MTDMEWRSMPPWRQNHVFHDARISSVTCTSQPEGQRGDVPPVVETGSQQGTLLNPHQIKTANCGVASYQELPGGFVGPYTYPDVGFTPDVPEPVLVPFPENQGNDFLGNASQGVVPSSTQAALPDPSAQRAPTPSQPAAVEPPPTC